MMISRPMIFCFAVTMILACTVTSSAQAASTAFYMLDSNGDGTLQIDELARIETLIADVDTDKDGTFSADEIGVVIDAVKASDSPCPKRIAQLEKAIAAIVPADEAEERIQKVLADLDKNQRSGNLNVPVQDAQLLRILVEALAAERVVEIGMSNGYSGIWMSAGLRKSDGRLTTHEIDEGRAKLARQNFNDAGLTDRITIVMGDAHETITRLKGPVDLVFIDADKERQIDYLQKMLPLVRSGGIILTHNATFSNVVKPYIEACKAHPQLDTCLVHMKHRGMIISIKK